MLTSITHPSLRACLPEISRETEMMAWVLQEGVISVRHWSHSEGNSWWNSSCEAIVLFGCSASIDRSPAAPPPSRRWVEWTWGACVICGGHAGSSVRLLLLLSVEEPSTGRNPVERWWCNKVMEVRLPWLEILSSIRPGISVACWEVMQQGQSK